MSLLSTTWRRIRRAFGLGTSEQHGRKSNRRRKLHRRLGVEKFEDRDLMAGMAIGMNLDNVVDWSPAWTFTDVFQSSRPWFAHDYNTVTRESIWHGTRPVQTDGNGNVTGLDSWTNASGQLMQQRVGTLMFRELNGAYPAGVYRAEWDGTGTVSFGMDARIRDSGRTADGRNFANLDVTPGSGGIYLRIDTTSSTDPVRNFHVWMPDHNGQSFAGQRWQPGANFSPFHPLFKEKLAPFGVLRFMQTQETVTSDIRTWADRRDANDIRQSSGNSGDAVNGIAVEYIVQLANELDADPWVNMPHQADDDFVRRFATYVRDNLEPGQKVYVEWSNEMWNWAPGFDTFRWLEQQAMLPENAGLTPYQIGGREAKRDLDIWSQVFAGQTQRLVRVGSGMAVNPWLTERTLEAMGDSFDAIAIAPYFGPTDAQRASYTSTTTVDQVLNDARANLVFSTEMTTRHQTLAEEFGRRFGRDIQLVAYEGGPHLDGRNGPYQTVFHQATNDPRMGDLMRDYLRDLNAAGMDVYVHYKHMDRDLVSQWGNFGVLNRQDQDLSTAHRYQALIAADNGTLFASTTTLVTAVAGDANAAETASGAANTGSFRITRGGDLTQPLTVNVAIGGNAVAGTDYTALPNTVTIPAGESFAYLTVTPINDTFVEGNETITLTLQSGTGYALIGGTTGAATVTLRSDDRVAGAPTLSVTASDPNASETGPDVGVFTVTRTGGDLNRSMTAYFQVSGTIQAADVETIGYSVVIPAGATSATVTVRPIDDTTRENSEAVTITLNEDAVNYWLGTSTATLMIADNDGVTPPPALPTVTLAATDANAAEAGADPAVFTVTRTGATTAALTVSYTVAGTATSGSDFTALTGSVTIAAGQSSATVTLTPINDTLVEANENVSLTLAASTTYVIGATNSASATIVSDDVAPPLPTVTLSVPDASAAEARLNPAVFRVARTGATTAPLTVRYTIGGTATNGSDYNSLSGTVTIAAGQSSATITVTPIDDTLVEANESVILTLATSSGYTVGTARQGTAALVSNDVAPLPTVSLSVPDANGAEAGSDPMTFRVTRTGATTAALTVSYMVSGTATSGSDFTALSGTVTIPAGAASANVTVTPINDTAVESNETVALTLRSSSTYTLGTATGTATLASDDTPTQTVLPVLMVIANRDFYYREYAESRAALEAASISVVVAATQRILSTPHTNSGQGSSSGQVMPDIALADAVATNYSAILFVGGWGASEYQYGFTGTYANTDYNGTTATRQRVNQLINDFTAQGKYVTAICHGVTVLAWARVNGSSPLAGRSVASYHGAAPASNVSGSGESTWHVTQNGATVFASGSLGNPATVADDVFVDGRFITAENYDAATRFGQVLAERLRS